MACIGRHSPFSEFLSQIKNQVFQPWSPSVALGFLKPTTYTSSGSIPTPFKSSTDLREPITYEPLTGRRGLANPSLLHGLETGPISHGKGCVRGGPTGFLENSK